MKKYTLIIIAFVITTGFTARFLMQPPAYDRDTPVSSILIALGEQAPDHYVANIDMEKVSLGKDIVLTGRAYLPDGTYSEPVSKFFICTDCHNVLPEAPFADDNDPTSRLNYAMEFNQPYLPGSTFHGIANRTSWFNGDHEKKYGTEMIAPTRHDLKKAIQLCSKECSSGRLLEDWELEAMLHYFSALELKLKDLNLTKDELAQISATGQTEAQKQENIKLIRSKFIQGYPATFVEAIPAKDRKLGETGNLEHGKWIYQKSCMHCHAEGRVTRTVFGEKPGQKNFDWLVSYFKKSNGGSVYWITRHGTGASEKTPMYMPIYSKEKLNDEQVEDLAAYILAESKK
jgi:mono/diheme cytochrome c family protein